MAEAVLAALIPGESNLINSLRGIVTSYGTNNLNSSQYGRQQIPYYVAGNDPTITALMSAYHVNSVPGATFVNYPENTINADVLAKRTSNVSAFIGDYYMSFALANLGGSLYASAHYNTLAFHSPAACVARVSNMLLQFISGSGLKSITTVNSPIPSTYTLSNQTSYLQLLACLDSLPVSLLNFFNAVIVAFIISIMVMSVARERLNGSKQLQLLSGTHYSVYWAANYLFDLAVCLVQISTLVIALKVVDAIKNDTSSETYAIAGDENLGYFFVLLLCSCLSWCTLAYIWSFFFKQDIIGFIVLLIIMAVVAFVDMVLTFIELLFQQNNGGTNNPGATFVYVVRWIITALLPNLVVKRGMYNLKIRTNEYCLDGVNKILYSKSNEN